jgi:hypothetical protein
MKKNLLHHVTAYVFLILLSAAPLVSCYDEENNCEEAPLDCQSSPSASGDIIISLTKNDENPSLLLKIYTGDVPAEGETKAPVWSGTVADSTFQTTLPLGTYSATVNYKYGENTITAIDSGEIKSEAQSYCEGDCYEDENAELDLELDTSAFDEYKSGEKSNCFIATAAFGSPIHKKVMVLKNFRDRVLLTNTPGRAFVSWYYRTSPPVADYIRSHSAAKIAVRASLFPLIFTIEHPWGVLFALFLIMMLVLFRQRVKTGMIKVFRMAGE